MTSYGPVSPTGEQVFPHPLFIFLFSFFPPFLVYLLEKEKLRDFWAC